MPKCETCGDTKGALFRQNPKGQPGVWRCLGCNKAPIDEGVGLVAALVENGNNPTKH